MFDDILKQEYTIERKEGNKWVKCRMKDIVVLDTFRYIEKPEWGEFIARSNGFRDLEGKWTVLGEHIEK